MQALTDQPQKGLETSTALNLRWWKWQTASLKCFLSFRTWNDAAKHKQWLWENPPPPGFEVSDERGSHSIAGQDERLIWDWRFVPFTNSRCGEDNADETKQRDVKYGFVITVMKTLKATRVNRNQIPLQGNLWWLICGLSGSGCGSSLTKDLTCALSTLTLARRNLIQLFKYADVHSLLQPLFC